MMWALKTFLGNIHGVLDSLMYLEILNEDLAASGATTGSWLIEDIGSNPQKMAQ